MGFHKLVSLAASNVVSNTLYPAAASTSDNWMLLGLTPILASGESAGSLIGRPSTALPDLSGIMTCAQLMGYLESAYNTYKVAIADDMGIYLCEAPLRVAITTEYGTTNRVATVLQLY